MISMYVQVMWPSPQSAKIRAANNLDGFQDKDCSWKPPQLIILTAKFTEKWNLSHYLLTSIQMKGQVKRSETVLQDSP